MAAPNPAPRLTNDMTDAETFAILNNAYTRRGEIGVLDVIYGGEELPDIALRPAGIHNFVVAIALRARRPSTPPSLLPPACSVWLMMRGMRLEDMLRRKAELSGRKRAMAVIRYIHTGAAGLTLGQMMSDFDRRAMRMVSRDWHTLLNKANFRAAEADHDARIAAMVESVLKLSKPFVLEYRSSEHTARANEETEALITHLCAEVEARVPFLVGRNIPAEIIQQIVTRCWRRKMVVDPPVALSPWVDANEPVRIEVAGRDYWRRR